MMPRPSPVNAHIPSRFTPASPVAPPSVANCPGLSFSTTVRSVGTSALHPETKLERHLVVVHGPLVGQVAAHLGDLEPVEVTQRLARSAQGNVDCLLDRVRRRSDDLAD